MKEGNWMLDIYFLVGIIQRKETNMGNANLEMARLKKEYMKRLLNEIRDFPAADIPKILKLIHFLKKEIRVITKRKDENLKLFWQSFGSWRDKRPAEEIIKEIYKSRKATTRDIHL
jgi:hypothetical protein